MLVSQFATLISSFILTATLNGCINCDRSASSIQAPQSLEGKTLSGTVKFGSGAFSGMEAYSFKTILTEKSAFKTMSSANAIESEGSYSYAPINDKTGKLILTDRSASHAGQEIEVTLQFSSSNAGTYSGRFLSGQEGEQSGTFRLQ